MHSRRRLAGAGGLLGASLLLFGVLQISTAVPAGAAATYVVNTLADTGGTPANCVSGTGLCTLRNAIQQYNTDSGAGSDAITFTSGLTGTIILTAGSLGISNATGLGLTITGNGSASTVVSGGGTSQVFVVLATTTGAVTIFNLTVANGKTAGNGGGIENRGNLTLSGVTVQSSTAGLGGGISNDSVGQLTANTVTVTGNTTTLGGGGVLNTGTFNATGFTVTQNSTTGGSGGGIANDGPFTATGVDIEHNSAVVDGGGIVSQDAALNLGTSTSSGGTIATNTATGGGGIAIVDTGAHAPATLDGVTVSGNAASGNGGGVLAFGQVSMAAGSSITGNTAATNGGGLYNEFNLGGVGPTLNGVTISGNKASSGGGIFDDVGGGGLTMTGGSISGNTATPGSGGGVSITPSAPTAEDTFSGVSITLNSAANNGGGIFQNAGGLLVNNGTSVSNNSAVTGQGGGVLLIGSTGSKCSTSISPVPAPPLPIPASNVCISGATVTGNSAIAPTAGGGGIFNSGATLLVNASSVSGNSASVDGAGIYSIVTVATVIASSISNNQIVAGNPTQFGAGFYGGNSAPLDAIYYSTISGNAIVATASGDGDGAGIFNNTGLSMIDDTVANNLGAFEGAGIFNSGANLVLKNVTISGNQTSQAAGSAGGGLFNGGSANLLGTILANDQAGIPLTHNECANTPVVSNGYNEDIGSTCKFTTANHDLSSSNPLLGPLANNGGPTLTEALSAGSPAIGVEPGALCPAVDQRGIVRGNPCSIGAFEGTGAPIPTTTTVTVSPTSVAPGATVTYSATVTSGSGTPTGTVTFATGSTTLCTTGTLVGGVGSCTATNAPPGTDTVTGSFTPTSGSSFAGSSGTTTLTVSHAPTTTAITVNPTSVVSGNIVTYSATVTGTGGPPTGTVAFTTGATTLCSATLAAGTGSCT
ncbi:MAG TPA: choice-of-anchor Q domain-containing protein, partial [Acidimicrobiales bacterium]|nr:choice-of-anchor Q domain-containing protein [Acidimicrobiales bacterium]